MSTITVPKSHIPIGSVRVGGNSYDVQTAPEFVRFFELLLKRLGTTGTPAADLEEMATQAMFAAMRPTSTGQQQVPALQRAWAPDASTATVVSPNVYRRAQTVVPVALTDAANIATDASRSNHFTVTLGGNRTLDNPTNLVNGVILNWKVKQDGTGSRTLAYGSKFKWPSGTAPTLTTSAAAVDYISAQYFSDDDILIASVVKDIR